MGTDPPHPPQGSMGSGPSQFMAQFFQPDAWVCSQLLCGGLSSIPVLDGAGAGRALLASCVWLPPHCQVARQVAGGTVPGQGGPSHTIAHTRMSRLPWLPGDR